MIYSVLEDIFFSGVRRKNNCCVLTTMIACSFMSVNLVASGGLKGPLILARQKACLAAVCHRNVADIWHQIGDFYCDYS